MSDPKALVDAGRLPEAVAELNEAIRSRPADGALRMFLFEVLCFQGDLQRAAKQLDVISTQASTAGTELTVQVYRGLLDGEIKRREVFEGDGLPKFMLPPPPHVERFVLLLKKLRTAPAEGAAMLADAEEASPAIGGERNGRAFADFRDADDRLNGVLEVLHGSDYLWVPLTQVTALQITPPKRLRDMMWTQARLTVTNQPAAEVLLPALYVGSYRHPNPQVALGRVTEWEAIEDSVVTGAGQRMFLIDGQDVPMFELGQVTFTPPAGAETQPS